MDAYDQRAVPLERDIEISGEISHHHIAAHVKAGHKGAFCCIETCVDDRAVCLGSSAADILFLVQYTDIEFIAGQFSCHRRACDAGSDDNYIV